jgi:filamentous hemagglutinin
MYSMGKGAVTHLWGSGKLLAHGVKNPGDVLDAMTEIGIEGSSQAVGGATFEAGMLFAPLAKGAPAAAIAKEGRHGVNLVAPKALQPVARGAAAEIPAGEAILQTAGTSGRTVGDFLDAARARQAATAAEFPEIGVLAQRRSAVLGGAEYEARIAELYGGRAAFSARTYEASVAGRRASGLADNVTRIDGQSVAVEAKYVDDWATSIRNPKSPMALGETFERGRAIAKAERATTVFQARKLSNAFDRAIYHTNSPELMQYYSRVFARYKLQNVDFVLTP